MSDPDQIVFVRHGETVLNVEKVVTGDPTTPQPLTAKGREQARELNGFVRAMQPGLCVTSGLPRTHETADIALAGTAVSRIAMEELNDPALGELERNQYDSYLKWLQTRDLYDQPPGGGESQIEVVARYARAFTRLVERPERDILVVCHELPISVARTVATANPPLLRQTYPAGIRHCHPYPIDRGDLARGTERLEEELAAAPAR